MYWIAFTLCDQISITSPLSPIPCGIRLRSSRPHLSGTPSRYTKAKARKSNISRCPVLKAHLFSLWNPLQMARMPVRWHSVAPGLHHLGCVAADLDPAIDYLAEFGLLLHPISLKHTRSTSYGYADQECRFCLNWYSDGFRMVPYAQTELELPCPIRHDYVGELIAGCSIRPLRIIDCTL